MKRERSQLFSSLKIVLYLLLNFVFECYCDENPLIFSTNECSLTEPVYGHNFDFNSLHSDLAHVTAGERNDVFEFNLCGNLTHTCSGERDVTACLKRGSEEFILGTQHQLNYRNGRMYFSFTNGSKCSTGPGNFQLHVFVECDYTVDTKPTYVTSYSSDACSFYITFETPYACLPEPDDVKTNTCNIIDPHTGHTYDLMPLSDNNYRTTDRNGSAFVINICKPVLYGENAMCPPGSSVCFVSLSSKDYKKKFFNYGTAQSTPVLSNGQLMLRYTSQTPCSGNDNYTSVINFYCDKDIKNAHPELIGLHGCVYEFSFVTPLACNNLAPCTAITSGNEVLDMSPLKGKPFTLRMQDKDYTFAVCSNAGSPCMESDGACFFYNNQTTSLGLSNTLVSFNKTGSPYILYSGGAKCEKSQNEASAGVTYWTTKIEFVCANNVTKDNGSTAVTPSETTASTSTNLMPKIIENSNCQLLIQYQTPLACQEQITCKAKTYVEHSEDVTGEEVVDLTPLIDANDNYEAKINWQSLTEQQVDKSTKFFLNVCRPLVPKFGLGCSGGTAACMAKVDSSAKPEREHSLGFPSVALKAINRTTAELLYLQGDSCPTDPKSELSAGLRFHCDMSAGRGNPVLETISDCHYQFKWATNVICPPHMCSFNADTCEIINDEINVGYNLKTAPFTSEGKIKINETSEKQFEVNICGEHRKALTDYSQGLVNLFFSEKGPCGVDGNINVQMRLICSSDLAHVTTFSNDLTQCSLLYVQRTPDICKFLGLTLPEKATPAPVVPETSTSTNIASTPTASIIDNSTEKPTENANHPAEITGSIGLILGAILTVTFFTSCIGMLAISPERRNAVRRLFRRGTSSVRYSRVLSNEEANLLLEPNGEFTDSDDDMLL